MNDVSILVRYFGEWEKYNLSYIYKGGKSKGIIVSKDISYAQLLNKIYNITKLHPRTHEIEMKYLYNVHGPTEPVEIEGDDDVCFFVRCNIDRNIPATSLCISSTDRANVDDVGENLPYGQDGKNFVNSSEVDTDFIGFGFSRNIETEPHIDISDVQMNYPVDDLVDDLVDDPVNDLVDDPVDVAVSDEASVGLLLGEIFVDKKCLHKKLSMYALKMHFQFRVVRSTKSLFVVGCCISGCNWWLRAVKVKDNSCFVIKKFRDSHLSSNCLKFNQNRHATGWVIGECIKSKYEGVGRSYRPNDIVMDFQKEHGVSVSYGQAWRARENAMDSIYGSPEESFAELSNFCAQLVAKNPGTITHTKYDSENRFKYFFMALGPCLRGFRTCMRPVFCVNAIHLKGKYKGTLFVATALDGNNQIYPLAFGAGDSENDASWEWFFEKLHDAIGIIPDLAIISVRNQSIEKGVQSVFPEAFHVACMSHIGVNMRAKKFSENVINLFYKAAKCYRQADFHHIMCHIRGFEEGRVYRYLECAGFEKWARAYFPTDRYNIMMTDIAECLNGILKEALFFPITELMKYLVEKLQKWFDDRRQGAIEMTNGLTNYYEMIARAQREKASCMMVEPISLYEFHVRDGDIGGQVNLQSRSCSCKVFDIDHMPCAHAFAACSIRNLPTMPLCSPYYTTDMLVNAYAESIYPIVSTDEAVVVEEAVVSLPPANRRSVGRPKEVRGQSAGVTPSTRICSRCKKCGHNRQTCREAIPLHPTTNRR